ncbi:alanine racemase [Alphaproteobacteria bacterium]|jgi:D-serine deaminase-like pyridoxal phosphate-dependent protein|nr:alanine racemase [Alphaproteobacteria bacterium]
MISLPCKMDDLPTPCLLLRRSRLVANCQTMATRMSQKGVSLRPHLKTAKSIDVAKLATAGHSGAITVSTLAELEFFAEHGVKDILYAVGIVPHKLHRVAKVVQSSTKVICITDGMSQVGALNTKAEELGFSLDLLIEVDVGGLRGGLSKANEVLDLAKSISGASHLSFLGIMTHAGHSYGGADIAEVKTIAEQERAGLVSIVEHLSGNSIECQIVSGGSTPTATHGENFDGLTEMRPGVYTFQDLDQFGLKSCALDDIVVSVLASVVGYNPRVGRILTDAGGLALSKDLAAKKFLGNTGYGWVADTDGTLSQGPLFVADVHQEHGLLATPEGDVDPDIYPVGSFVTILPNHICMTAAAYDGYYIVEDDGQVTEFWPRVNGW